MARRSVADIEKIWSHVEGVRKLSDRAVGLGPFGVGLDGLLAFVPVVGTAYSLGAAGWLLWQARRVKASPATLARMAAYLGVDSAMSAVGEAIPLAPDLLDFFFQGHLFAARVLQKEMEQTHWVEAREEDARETGAHDHHLDEMRRRKLRRLVYLHD